MPSPTLRPITGEVSKAFRWKSTSRLTTTTTFSTRTSAIMPNSTTMNYTFPANPAFRLLRLPKGFRIASSWNSVNQTRAWFWYSKNCKMTPTGVYPLLYIIIKICSGRTNTEVEDFLSNLRFVLYYGANPHPCINCPPSNMANIWKVLSILSPHHQQAAGNPICL